jgi:dihydroorotate dehydrogenase (fumarate)
MADLRTSYLGMKLRSPLVASSSPLTGSLDGLCRLEAAGAGAVVLLSLFEEGLAEAGASALELNIYYVSSQPGLSGSDVEWHYLDVVRAVRQATRLPLAVKLSPYFSALANMAGQLVEAGANGLVLFNRFYQPDLDIEAMEVRPALELSSSVELRLPLRWIAILHRRHRISLAASTGVHTATDVLKVLLAGADVAMMTSALLRNGPDHLRPLEVQVRDWMDRHGFDTLDQFRGRLSQRSVPDPAAFERANYIKTLASHVGPGTGRRRQ